MSSPSGPISVEPTGKLFIEVNISPPRGESNEPIMSLRRWFSFGAPPFEIKNNVTKRLLKCIIRAVILPPGFPHYEKRRY